MSIMFYLLLLFLLISFFTFFILEKFFPFFHNEKLFKKKIVHYSINFIFGFANWIIIFIIYISCFKVISKFLKINFIGLLGVINFPYVLEIIIGLILFDLWMYIWHLLNHKLKFLWIFHRMHHSDINLDISTSIRFHPLEILISIIFQTVILMIIGIDLKMLFFYIIIFNFINIFHHSNFNLSENVDEIMQYIFVTPNMHRIHHSQLLIENNSNYSSTISIWDRVFRTFKRRVFPKQVIIGLKEYTLKKWQKPLGMLQMPFIKS